MEGPVQKNLSQASIPKPGLFALLLPGSLGRHTAECVRVPSGP